MARERTVLIDDPDARPLSTTQVGGEPVLDVNIVGGGTGGGTVDQGDPAVVSKAWPIKLTDGTDTADVLDLSNSNPLTVAIVDGSGDQITSFGGGVQYTEGDTDASITGTAMLWEDTSDTLRAVSAAKPLPVNIVAGSSSGTEYTEAASAAANPTGGMLMAVSISSPSAEVSSGQNVALRATTSGRLYVTTEADDRLVSLSDSVTLSTSVLPAGSFLMGLKSGTSQWARLRIEPDNADAISVDSTGHLQVLGHTLVFNGTSWDRVRGDTTNGMDVDVTRVQGTVAVTQSGTWILGANSGVDIGDVTINNAAGASAVNIQDGGNSITVDGTVAATQSGTWTVQPGNTANTTAWLVTGTGGTFPVTDSGGSLTVDNGGTFAVQATIAAGATNIAKAEDAASADADVGVPAMAVRKATPANTSGTDGDYEMLQMSAGRLWTSSTIDAALPAGTNAIGKLASNSGVTIGAVEIAASQTLATVTTVGAVTAITNALPAGTNAIGKLAANSGVDIGDVDVTSVTPGTTASALGKAEDAGHTTGDVGVMALAVRNDTAAALAGTTADYIPLTTNSIGALWQSPVPVATPTLSNVAASASSVTILSANTSRRQVVLVNDSSAICYVKFGTTASTTSYTVQMPAIANNQAAHLFIDENPIYTGRIDAIWASATGNMRVTEITT